MAGARRYVWNWALAQRGAHYAMTGQSLPAARILATSDRTEATARDPRGSKMWTRRRCSKCLPISSGPTSISLRSAPDPLDSKAASGIRHVSVFRNGCMCPRQDRSAVDETDVSGEYEEAMRSFPVL